MKAALTAVLMFMIPAAAEEAPRDLEMDEAMYGCLEAGGGYTSGLAESKDICIAIIYELEKQLAALSAKCPK